MSYQVRQGNLLGRIGQNFAEGLGTTVPKEMERLRLSDALQSIGSNPNLNQFERFAQLASAPGSTPQIQQSGTEILNRMAQGDAFRKQADIQSQPRQKFPGVNPVDTNQPPSNIPSLTKEDVFAKTQEGYVPPTLPEIAARASALYSENPEFFKNDPAKAFEYAQQEEAQKEKIAEANQTKYANLEKIQDNVVRRLNEQSKKLGTQIPADLYSSIEDEAIQATKPQKEGGRGLTEQQAMKEYGAKMDEASRQFSNLETVGNWSIATKPAKETIDQINKIQNVMEGLDQTQNMALKLISDSKLSPGLAFSLAQPIHKVPGLNKYLNGIPTLDVTETPFATAYDTQRLEKTMAIADHLGRFVKADPKASPLAIARVLDEKGYDGQAFLNHLAENPQQYNLRQRQLDQLTYPKDNIKPFNDWWLQAFTGTK